MQRRDLGSWEEVVNRMIELAAPRITPAEGAQILHYLSETHTPPQAVEQGTILEKHCLPCHNPMDILGVNYSRAGWRESVRQLREYGPEFVPEEKIDEIADYLIEMQQDTQGPKP